jgi:hypothetical protein
MNNRIKTYKIIVDSKLFVNIRGASPAEVAKKAASKIFGNSLNRARFSIQEKTGKIRHYDAKQENLVRPYHKNGKLVKYQIIVKKIGKQVGGTYPPNIEPGSDDPIFDFFPRGEYKIEIISHYTPEVFPITKYHITSNSVWCIDFHFEIDKRKIELDNLNKCYNKSGSDNLKKIIKYGKYLKSYDIIDKIELFDASTIYDKKISLALLSILSTGMSWYNSFGFISPNFKVEKENNSKFLRMQFDDFLNLCSNILFEQKKEYYDNLNKQILELEKYKEKKGNLSNQLKNSLAKKLNNKRIKNTLNAEGLIEYIMEELNAKKKLFIDTFNNLTVQEVFTNIKERLKSQLSEQELNIIIELFSFLDSSRIILYHLGLTLMLGRTYPPNLQEDSDDPIFTFFPRGEYKIEIIKRLGKDCVNIENCVLFYIEDNILYLEYIEKCQSSETVNLNKIINYAKLMNLESIKLADSSEILSGISMPIIFILANGISWYNQYGFISGEENFIEEKKHNFKLINLSLKEFFTLISNKNNNNNISKFIQIMDKYGFNEESKVQDIFIKIKELLKNNQMNQDELKILKRILFYIQLSSIILYNPELTKKL